MLARRKMTLHGNLWRANRRSPISGVPVKSGLLILEAGDIWGDELSSVAAGDCDGSGRDDKDSPGLDV